MNKLGDNISVGVIGLGFVGGSMLKSFLLNNANAEGYDKYKDGVRTLLGIHSNGYPNMYIMGGYQASFSFNLVDILRKQGDHIARTINYAKELGEKHGQKFAAITCTYKAEDYWVNEVISHRGKSNYSKDKCQSCKCFFNK